MDNKPLIDVPDYKQISRNFAHELMFASQGKKTSLPFIKNPLPKQSLIRPNQTFQAFVIGGTNGAMAIAHTEDGTNFTIMHQTLFHPLPFFTSFKNFVSFIVDNLDNQTSVIGINFAYNLIPVIGKHGELDGIMNEGNTKGHAFTGLYKQQVGKVVRHALKEKTGRDILVTVANDTICLITSGLKEHIDKNTLIAAIAGTGYNIALFLDSNTAVNLQTSDFTKFTQTASGKIVDRQSTNPGEQIYNKEVAAGELYKHFNAYISLLSLSTRPIQSSEELSEIAKIDSKEGQVEKELINRSASLIAAQFAGIYEFKGKLEQIICIAQGSLFWKEPNYIGMLQKQLSLLGIPKDTIKLKQVENSDIIGAIKLLTGEK